MKLRLALLIVLASAVGGWDCNSQPDPGARFAVKHFTSPTERSLWESDGGSAFLIIMGTGYRLKTDTGGKTSDGKKIYRFEYGRFKVSGRSLLAHASEVYTTTTEHLQIAPPKMSSAIGYLPLENKKVLPGEVGRKRTIFIDESSAEPSLNVDGTRLKFVPTDPMHFPD